MLKVHKSKPKLRRTILIVDDDPVNRLLMVTSLMDANPDYRILNAIHGKQAIEIAGESHPDIIIMDWEMPEMSGIEAIHSLKQNPSTHDIPVIMCTGARTSTGNLKTALDEGAIDFIRKPVEPVELIARVKSMLLLTTYYHEKIQVQELNYQLEQEKARNSLEMKQRELHAITLQMISINHIMNDALQILTKLSDRPATEKEVGIQKAIESLRENLGLESFWQQFMLQFNVIHTGFIHKLVQRHPDITQTDMKVCSMIKSNLSTKEISQILNVTPEAVEKSRQRLRKKLNLEGMSLSGYLNNI